MWFRTACLTSKAVTYVGENQFPKTSSRVPVVETQLKFISSVAYTCHSAWTYAVKVIIFWVKVQFTWTLPTQAGRKSAQGSWPSFKWKIMQVSWRMMNFNSWCNNSVWRNSIRYSFHACRAASSFSLSFCILSLSARRTEKLHIFYIMLLRNVLHTSSIENRLFECVKIISFCSSLPF